MSRPTDQETIEHLAERLREFIPSPRITSAADRKLLHDLAVLLAERTAGVLRVMRTETITFDGLTATAAATTAATTALIACSEDADPPEPDNGPPPAFVEGTTALSLLLHGDPAKVDRSETGAVVQRALEELAKAAKGGA